MTDVERIIEEWNGKFHFQHQKSVDEVNDLAKAIEQYVQDKLKTEASLWKLAMAEKESEREQYVIKARIEELRTFTFNMDANEHEREYKKRIAELKKGSDG